MKDTVTFSGGVLGAVEISGEKGGEGSWEKGAESDGKRAAAQPDSPWKTGKFPFPPWEQPGAASHPEGLRQGNPFPFSFLFSFPTSLRGAGCDPGAECRPANLIPAGNTDVVLLHGLQLLDVIHVGRHRGVEGLEGDVASWNDFLDL